MGLVVALPLVSRVDRPSFLATSLLVALGGWVVSTVSGRNIGLLRIVLDFAVCAGALWVADLWLSGFYLAGIGLLVAPAVYTAVSALMAPTLRRVLISRNLGNRQDG